jgi:rfaE bifunctional protein nucleotidyltransferase chain/domain
MRDAARLETLASLATFSNPKIKDLDELAAHVRTLKALGKRIVLSHGVFDLLHVGHIRHLEQAKHMGDVLVVTLTEDHFVNKGPHRPAFSQSLRAESIAALGAVDFVAVNRWPRSVETIRLLRPDVYAKGSDYKIAEQDVTGGITAETEAVQDVGGEIRFTDDITFSSSQLLNEFLSPFSKEVGDYLAAFRVRHSADELLSWIDRASRVRPVVVGEAIIDEYVFCAGIGKSTKDPVLAVLQESIETVAGGALAIANHLAGLCGEVGLITQLGEMDRREDFVRDALSPNVCPLILTKEKSPTICKRRIVDRYSGNKLLEIYVMEERLTAGGDASMLIHTLDDAFQRWDLTVVADYGHGMLPPDAIGLTCRKARFLAVNVQANAGNRGFNHISKYQAAEYMCMAGHEVALEVRQRDLCVRDALLELARRVACPRFTVTTGKEGTIHYDKKTGFTECPALATRVADRVGAGDAVLAVTSLLAYLGAPCDILGFVGNVAGAQLVAQLGNRVPLNKMALSKHIVSLLK